MDVHERTRPVSTQLIQVSRAEESWNEFRRRVELVLLLLGVIAVLLARWLELNAHQPAPIDRIALPALALIFLAMALLLGFGPRYLGNHRAVGLSSAIAYAALTIYALFSLSYQLRVYLPRFDSLSEATYWFGVLYLLAFVNWDFHRALFITGATYVGMLILGLVYAPSGLGKSGDLNAVGFVIQFYLSGLVQIGMLYMFARIKQHYGEMRALAHMDYLTGLPNRRLAQELLEREFERAHRYGRPLSLIMFDLDHFKHVNDRYGHEAGDLLLCEVARLVAGRMRSRMDTLVRWGGEEFLMLLPESGQEAAYGLAERIRCMLAAETSEGIQMTASFGMVEIHPEDTPASAIRRADQALYLAKDQGRDRVARYRTVGKETT